MLLPNYYVHKNSTHVKHCYVLTLKIGNTLTTLQHFTSGCMLRGMKLFFQGNMLMIVHFIARY